MNDNTKLNTFLSAIIVSLCVVIGVLCYFVFGDDFQSVQPELRTRATAVQPVVEEPAKPKPKKKAKVDDGKPIYVMGEDGEAARRGQIGNNITVIRGDVPASASNTIRQEQFNTATKTAKAEETYIGDETPMIGNKSSMIYHYPNCNGVAIMNEHNKIPMTAGEAKRSGYRLHKGCPD